MLSSHAFSESCSLSRPPVLPAHNLDGLGLQDLGHWPDARLCTSLIKVASSHGQGATALGMYEWMRARREEGGAALHGTVHTYTVAMRAALAANMLPQALKVKPSHPTSPPPPPPGIQRIIQASSEDRLLREANRWTCSNDARCGSQPMVLRPTSCPRSSRHSQGCLVVPAASPPLQSIALAAIAKHHTCSHCRTSLNA